MSQFKYGDIYWVSKKVLKKIAGHWIVVFYYNEQDGVVYYQTLSSRIQKVFPNFGFMSNKFCVSCSKHPNYKDHARYHSNPWMLQDVDTVTFLNHVKYNFLDRETVLCLKNVEKDLSFDFKQKVQNGVYRYVGNLLPQNKRGTLISLHSSPELSRDEVRKMIDFCQTT